METLNIGEIARLAGVQTSAIRYYESIGLLPEPPRSSGWRRYSADIVERLQVIRTARMMGFSLEEILILLDGFPTETDPAERWRVIAEQKLPEVEAIIEQALNLKSLLEAGLNCQCADVEECISSQGKACITPVDEVVI